MEQLPYFFAVLIVLGVVAFIVRRITKKPDAPAPAPVSKPVASIKREPTSTKKK